MSDGTKVCRSCQQVLPVACFGKRAASRDGLHYNCKACCVVENKRSWLQRYGLTFETFDQLLAQQGNKCAICPATEPGGKGIWHVDHDHVTQKVRGLLCHLCNVGLGHFRDDVQILKSAIVYLEMTKGGE